MLSHKFCIVAFLCVSLVPCDDFMIVEAPLGDLFFEQFQPLEPAGQINPYSPELGKHKVRRKGNKSRNTLEDLESRL